jgi:hypothetical protein
MKKFIVALITGLFAIFTVPAMAQQVAACQHDVAPYDLGRYARDMKSGNVMSTTKIPAGTVWETNMKGGRFIVCRTTKERTVAIMKDNTFYDIACGNEVKIALPPQSVIQRVAEQPGTTTIQAGQECTNEESCKKVEWCNSNNGWIVSGDERVCRIPGRNDRIVQEDVLNIDRHLTVNPRILETTVNPWQGNGDFRVPAAPQARGNVASSQGPAVDFGRPQPGSVSGVMCYTQGCSNQPLANFVGQVPSTYCGIRTSHGKLFKLVRNSGRVPGALMMIDISSGTDGRAMAIQEYNIDREGWDCDKAQISVEKQHWAGVTSFFSLPNACSVTQRLKGPIARQ